MDIESFAVLVGTLGVFYAIGFIIYKITKGG